MGAFESTFETPALKLKLHSNRSVLWSKGQPYSEGSIIYLRPMPAN